MTCDRVGETSGGRWPRRDNEATLAFAPSSIDVEVREHEQHDRECRQVGEKLKLEHIPITEFTAWVRSEDDIPELARAIVENEHKLLALVPRRRNPGAIVGTDH